MTQLLIELDGKQEKYLLECAAKRGISKTRMGRLIMNAVLDLRLVDDTLDDEGKVYENNRGRAPRAPRADAPPPFVRGGSISSRGQAPTVNYRRPVVQTRGEIRRDFHEAARNTVTSPSVEEVQRMSPDEVRKLLDSRRGLTFDDTHLGRETMLGIGCDDMEKLRLRGQTASTMIADDAAFTKGND